MVYFYQLFLNTDDVILKLYTSLYQKAKCTLFVWSTVLSWKSNETSVVDNSQVFHCPEFLYCFENPM